MLYEEQDFNIIHLTQFGMDGMKKVILKMDIFKGLEKEIEDYYKNQAKSNYSGQVRAIKKIMKSILLSIRKGELYDYYDSWIRFENLFNILGIRDHFLHNFETFLLGCYLLSAFDKSGFNFKDIDMKDEDILFSWILASTFHDIGYPVEKFSFISSSLSKLYEQFRMFSISEQMSSLRLNKNILDELYILYLSDNIRYLGEEVRINLKRVLRHELMKKFSIDEDSARGVLDSLESEFQHGLVSACVLLRQVLSVYGVHCLEHKRKFQMLKDAAAAILMHHYVPHECGEKINISFGREPVVAMLYLCDEIQEWNRPLDDFGVDVDESYDRLTFHLNGVETAEESNLLKVSIFLEAKGAGKSSNQDIENVLNAKVNKFNMIRPLRQNSGKGVKLYLKVAHGSDIYKLEKSIIERV